MGTPLSPPNQSSRALQIHILSWNQRWSSLMIRLPLRKCWHWLENVFCKQRGARRKKIRRAETDLWTEASNKRCFLWHPQYPQYNTVVLYQWYYTKWVFNTHNTVAQTPQYTDTHILLTGPVPLLADRWWCWQWMRGWQKLWRRQKINFSSIHVSTVKIKTWASILNLLHAEENSNLSLGHFSTGCFNKSNAISKRHMRWWWWS